MCRHAGSFHDTPIYREPVNDHAKEDAQGTDRRTDAGPSQHVRSSSRDTCDMVPGPGVGELSEDRWWFWDGIRWVPVISPDGRWRWDGVRWAPFGYPGTAAHGPAVQAGVDEVGPGLPVPPPVASGSFPSASWPSQAAGPPAPGYPPPGYPGYTGYPAAGGYTAPPPPGPAPGVVYAGFGPRLGAYAIDGLITGVPATAVVLAAMWPQIRDAIDRASRGEQAGTTLVGPPAWVSLLFAALSFLYFSGQWALWGRTLGMRVARCRVVRELDGGAPTFEQSVRRGVFFWGPGVLGWIPGLGTLLGLLAVIGMLLAFADARKQGWPDKFAKTFVVRPYS